MDNEYKRVDDREYHDATCDECGQKCKVPFVPIEGRPIFCKTCYKNRKPTNNY